MLLHGLDEPRIHHDNSLERNVREYKEDEKFDVILMNPPYGGGEKDIIKQNFPAVLRSSETADLFMALIMYRLKNHGRCAVILPDGFLFGNDTAKRGLKEKLLNEFNLHTIVRMPGSVFAPYTSITTNILFFEKNANGTKETWFYRLDKPKGYKHFSKTKPILLEHFKPAIEWWTSREELTDEEGNFKSKRFTKAELAEKGYDFDQCKFPQSVEEIFEPDVLIKNYFEKKKNIEINIKNTLDAIMALLEKK